MRKKTIWLLFIAVGFLIPPWATVSNLQTANARQGEEPARESAKSEWELLFPEGEGKGYVLALCQQCHTLKYPVLQRHDESGWRGVIDSMSSRGAKFDEEDVAIMAKYLAENFGPNQPPLEIPLDLNKAGREQLALLPQLMKEEAAKILEARKRKAFKDLADLKQVLSDEKIAKIKPFVVLH